MFLCLPAQSVTHGMFALCFHELAAHLQLFGSLSSFVPIAGLATMCAPPLLYAQGYLLQCSNKCTASKDVCYLNCKADPSPMLYKPSRDIQSVLGLQMALKQKYPAVLEQPQSSEALCTATCCLTASGLIAADSPRARWQLCWNQPQGSGQAPEVEPARGGVQGGTPGHGSLTHSQAWRCSHPCWPPTGQPIGPDRFLSTLFCEWLSVACLSQPHQQILKATATHHTCQRMRSSCSSCPLQPCSQEQASPTIASPAQAHQAVICCCHFVHDNAVRP